MSSVYKSRTNKSEDNAKKHNLMITPRGGFCLETKLDETAVLSENNLPEPFKHEINGVE
jgi:hypothetical protein